MDLFWKILSSSSPENWNNKKLKLFHIFLSQNNLTYDLTSFPRFVEEPYKIQRCRKKFQFF